MKRIKYLLILIVSFVEVVAQKQIDLTGSLLKKSYEFSSIVIRNDTMFLIAEKCKTLFFLNKQTLKPINSVSLDSKIVHRDVQIEGCALYKNHLIMVDEKVDSVYQYDLSNRKTSLVIKNIKMSNPHDSDSFGLEGIAINSSKSICYILREKNLDKQSEISVFNIIESAGEISLKHIKTVLVKQDPLTRYSDLYFDETTNNLFCIKSYYLSQDLSKNKYIIDKISVDSTTGDIPSIDNNISSLSLLKDPPVEFEELSGFVNDYNPPYTNPDGILYSTNMEGIYIDGDTFYLISDNGQQSVCDSNRTDLKTLLITFDKRISTENPLANNPENNSYVRYILNDSSQLFFASNYMLKGIRKDSSFLYAPSTSIRFDSDSFRLSGEEKVDFKKDLLVYISETRNNLLDDSSHQKSDYDNIWPGFYDIYLNEIDTLISYLKYGTISNPLQWIPDPQTLEPYLNSFTKASIDSAGALSLRQKQFQLYRHEAFRSWLYDWMNEKLYKTPFPFKEIDIEYKIAWRELENWYNIIDEQRKVLSQFRETDYDIKAFQKEYVNIKLFLDSFNRNPIVSTLKNDDTFIKKVSWFNGGFININPLIVTENDRRYPLKEKNKFLKPEFTRFADSLQESGWLKNLFTTQQLTNKVTLPIVNTEDLKSDDETMLVQYDASDKYAAFGKFNKFVYKKDTVIIAVHNIPLNNSIDIKVTLNAKEDEGRQVSTLNEFLSPIGKMVAMFSPLAGAAGKVMSVIGPSHKKYSLGIASPTVLPTGTSLKGRKAVAIYEMKKGKKKYPIYRDDPAQFKKGIILGFFKNPDIPVEQVMEELIDEFISRDTSILDDSKSIRRFQESFLLHLGEVLNVQLDTLTRIQKETEAFVRISNRSLPPKEIKAKKNNNPTLRSEVRKEKLGKPTQEIGIVVSETSKESKEQREVAEYSFNLAKKHYFDVSAGISYTYFKNFNTISSNENSLPSVEPAKHQQFIGALHYYPWGMTKIDDGWSPKWERISIFAGLSFNKTLDNYYGGISYDIVPGFKAMAGVHLYRNTRFKVFNDQVHEKASALTWMGPSFSLNVAPTILGTLLGFFK